MTTVEAMQNYCVPIVIDGGGQAEIVEHGVSGFRFNTIKELLCYTVKVINDENLRKNLAVKAYERSHQFNSEVFKRSALELFSEIELNLRGVDSL
jgi:glycosyltransferase involved in cell wall biosynthesis